VTEVKNVIELKEVVPKKRRKVAILGYTPTRLQAPYDNIEEFEIWGLNDLYRFKSDTDVKRWDRWFEIHTEKCIRIMDTVKLAPNAGREKQPSADDHLKELGSWNVPVYMVRKFAEVPNGVIYPLDEIVKEFGKYFLNSNHVKYFTNSIAYMIALAIYEKFEEIHVYGVDMATSGVDNEYAKQRPSCEFWLGVAIGRGIKIHVPDESDLLKTRYLYGFEDDEKSSFDLKLDNIEQDVKNKQAQAISQKNNWQAHELQYMGALQAIKEIKMVRQ